MRKVLLLAATVILAPAAAAADADTVCATIYVYLSQSARTKGMSGEVFDAAAIKAEDAHLARNPADDRAQYALTVGDGVQVIEEGLARGTITANTVMETATGCNARYSPDSSSQAWLNGADQGQTFGR